MWRCRIYFSPCCNNLGQPLLSSNFKSSHQRLLRHVRHVLESSLEIQKANLVFKKSWIMAIAWLMHMVFHSFSYLLPNSFSNYFFLATISAIISCFLQVNSMTRFSNFRFAKIDYRKCQNSIIFWITKKSRPGDTGHLEGAQIPWW